MAKTRLYTSDQLALACARMKSNYRESAGILMQLQIAVSALRDTDLDNASRRVLGAILTLANRDDGEAVFDRSSIASLCGLAEGTVTNKLTKLRRLDYVANARVSLGQGQGTASVYQLNGFTQDEIEQFTAALEAAQSDLLGLTANENQPDTVHQTGGVDAAIEEKAPVTVHQIGGVTKSVSEKRPDTGHQNGGVEKSSTLEAIDPVDCKSQLHQSGGVTHAGAHTRAIYNSLPKEESVLLGESENLTKIGSQKSKSPDPVDGPIGRSERGRAWKPDWTFPTEWLIEVHERYSVSKREVWDESKALVNWALAASGQNARKKDWRLTWLNWVARKKWPERKPGADMPEMFSAADQAKPDAPALAGPSAYDVDGIE